MYFAIPFQFFIKGAAARKTAGKPNGDSGGGMRLKIAVQMV